MTALAAASAANEAAHAANQARDELIRQAHSEGSSIRTIAKATGLSASRIHQIIHGR
jgi:hypothetical protein